MLHVCGLIGTAGGTGCVIEFAGQAIRELSMEARMSISNMAIEAGARAGVIAPDDVTFEYIKGRPMAPRPDSQEWEDALANWRALASDEGAVYEAGEIIIDADDIAPTVTWGTSPQVSAARPPRAAGEPARASREAKRALLAARALGFADSERARRTSRARAPLLRSRAPQDTTSILGHVPVPDDPSQGGSDDPARVAGIKRSLECVPRVARARARGRGPSRLPLPPPRILEASRPPPFPLAIRYMGLEGGEPMSSLEVDKVFIGSCTNGRIEDMREAAKIAKGRTVAPNVKTAMIVPGSGLVKQQAEAEGLDRVFEDAGFEWREPGCSMCLAMNADKLGAGERCASTSNRNFEGRQGYGGRTHLVSPAMAAAAAIEGHFVDVRSYDYDRADAMSA